jgi:hypothetical protein
MLLARLKSAVTANEEFDAWLQHPLPPGGAAPDVIAMMARHAIENWRGATSELHATLERLRDLIDDMAAEREELESDVESLRITRTDDLDGARHDAFHEARATVYSVRESVTGDATWTTTQVLDLLDRAHDEIGS